jgi:hypothetical protein
LFLHLLDTEGKLGINKSTYHLFIAFKEVYDSISVEVLYNILAEFCIPMKLVKIIKIFKSSLGKYLSLMSVNESGLKQEDALLSLIFT